MLGRISTRPPSCTTPRQPTIHILKVLMRQIHLPPLQKKNEILEFITEICFVMEKEKIDFIPRYRIDSDITDADYSTDDDSTRLFYSETDGDHSGGGTCSCSQPCSRRSSYGYANSMDDSQVLGVHKCSHILAFG